MLFVLATNKNMKKFLITILLLFPALTLADVSMLPKVRVSYRLDGGVSITSFVTGACQGGESETQCMDREMQKNPELAGLPHDDLLPSQLPQDRKDRDKWRGTKGQGISIDYSLVTKGEKMKNLENLLDIAINNSDTVQVAKLQRLIQKLGQYNAPNGLIPPADLSKFDVNQPLTLGAIQTSPIKGVKLSFWQRLLNILIFWK